MDQNNVPAVELKHVSKRFAKVLANDDVSITINRGEVVALLGENGAGKSTIMKILYGLYHATSGEILIDGKKEKIASPEDAVKLGISMIQQHFSLVPAHTVTENIILGNCKGIIDKYRKVSRIFNVCSITAESQLGKGSTFRFRLPKGIVRMTIAVLFGCSLSLEAHASF